MPAFVPELLARLSSEFDEHRDPSRAVGARAYMRDQFEFYGIPAPVQREVARRATAGLARPTEKQLRALTRACWRKPEREWQYFACAYLRRHIGVCTAAFLSEAERLITMKSWWDTVDSLAAHTVGGLVRIHPELAKTMDRWVASENIWIVRTTILHQLTYKSSTDSARLFAYCARRAHDREFFIRKAIGWALREYSKTDAAAVRRFVKEHTADLAPLSRTEALKWLERRASR